MSTRILALGALLTWTVALPAETLPPEVAAFVQQREACDHFRGEPVEGEGPEALARLEFVQRKLIELCSGSDAALLELRERHAAQPAVMAALDAFEYPIEDDLTVQSDIDIAAEPTLQSGVYGPMTLGVDQANGRFSGVLDAGAAPACKLRFSGLMDRVDEPLRVVAQTLEMALSPDSSESLSGRMVPGLDVHGKPSAWLRLDVLPAACPAFAAIVGEQSMALSQQSSGNWISMHWAAPGRAYFHDEADERTRRKAYVLPGDGLRGYRETAAFLEAEYLAPNGRATRGWVSWSELMPELSLGDGAEM